MVIGFGREPRGGREKTGEGARTSGRSHAGTSEVDPCSSSCVAGVTGVTVSNVSDEGGIMGAGCFVGDRRLAEATLSGLLCPDTTIATGSETTCGGSVLKVEISTGSSKGRRRMGSSDFKEFKRGRPRFLFVLSTIKTSTSSSFPSSFSVASGGAALSEAFLFTELRASSSGELLRLGMTLPSDGIDRTDELGRWYCSSPESKSEGDSGGEVALGVGTL